MSIRFALVSLALIACGQVDNGVPDAGPGDDAPNTSLTVTVDPARRFIRLGDQAIAEVAIQRGGIAGPVTVTLAPLPGLTVDPLTIPDGADRGELVLQVADNAPFARTTLELTAAAEGAVASAPLTLEIIGLPGTTDPTFGTSGSQTVVGAPGANETPAFAIAQGDRVVVGIAIARDGKQGIVVMRRDRTGAADPSFGTAGEAFVDLSTISITSNGFATARAQPDGRIVIAGCGTNAGNEFDPFLVRLTADGQLDTTLPLRRVDTTTASLAVRKLALGPAGEIVLGGQRNNTAANTTDAIVIRLDATGIKDAGFGSSGIMTFNETTFDNVSGLAVQADGRIVALISTNGGNQFELSLFALRRFGTDGRLDATFGTSGKSQLPTPEGSAGAETLVSPDGLNLVVAGHVRGSLVGADMAIWRFLADGRPDLGFAGGIGYYAAPATEPSDALSSVIVAEDGTIYGVGSEAESFALTQMNLVHLDAAGVPDPAFGTAGVVRSPTAEVARAMVLRDDHRLMVVASPVFPDAGVDTSIKSFWH